MRQAAVSIKRGTGCSTNAASRSSARLHDKLSRFLVVRV